MVVAVVVVGVVDAGGNVVVVAATAASAVAVSSIACRSGSWRPASLLLTLHAETDRVTAATLRATVTVRRLISELVIPS